MIFHGSLEKVVAPEIRESNRTLDYGSGFYTTTSYELMDLWPMTVFMRHLLYLYEGGLIDKQTLIAELKAYRLVDQYLFHTDRSLLYVKFKGAYEVTL